MEFRPDLARVTRDWMESPIPVPASLKDPLGLTNSATVQRATLVMVLVRELGLEHRTSERPLRMTTNKLILDLVSPLAHVCDLQTVRIAAIAPSVVDGSVTSDQRRPLDLADAAGAVLDFGWAHKSISEAPESALVALDDIGRIYRSEMERQVQKMLRRWETRGWLVDAVAA